MYGNNYGNNYGIGYNPYGIGYQQPIQTQPTIPQQAKTNKIFVTSLEDAMARSVEPNSEYIYLHQDKNLIMEVKTDIQGKKTWKVYEFKEYVEPASEPTKSKRVSNKDFVSKEDFEAFKNEFKAFKESFESEAVE